MCIRCALFGLHSQLSRSDAVYSNRGLGHTLTDRLSTRSVYLQTIDAHFNHVTEYRSDRAMVSSSAHRRKLGFWLAFRWFTCCHRQQA